MIGATLVVVGGRDPADDPAAPTSAPAAPVRPLLGTPGTAPARAALAVKVDDTAHGRPPTGLTQADVVFEAMVEGGLTG